MLAIQSYWSAVKPALSARANCMMMALSCWRARQFFDRLHLVTDTPGKELLVDRIGLPFTSVSTELDRLDKRFAALFALGKLKLIAEASEPFVYMDTDVFLWKPLPERLLGAPVFAQNIEDWIWPVPPLAGISKRWTTNPYLHWNTGIFGGHVLARIKKYGREAFEIATREKNLAVINATPELSQRCMVYLDQWGAYAHFPKEQVETLFSGCPPPRDEVETAGFTHLLGPAKYQRNYRSRIEVRLEQENRDLYLSCIEATE